MGITQQVKLYFEYCSQTVTLTVNYCSVDIRMTFGGMCRTLLMGVGDDAAQREVSEVIHLEALAVDRLSTAALRPVVNRVAGSCRVPVGRRASVGVVFRNTRVGRQDRRVVAS